MNEVVELSVEVIRTYMARRERFCRLYQISPPINVLAGWNVEGMSREVTGCKGFPCDWAWFTLVPSSLAAILMLGDSSGFTVVILAVSVFSSWWLLSANGSVLINDDPCCALMNSTTRKYCMYVGRLQTLFIAIPESFEIVAVSSCILDDVITDRLVNVRWFSVEEPSLDAGIGRRGSICLAFISSVILCTARSRE